MFPQNVLSKSRWLALVFAGYLSACAVGPDFKQPEAPKTSSYTETTLSKKLTTAPGVPGGTEQEFIEGADIEAGWWELYKSPELDILIKKALQQNPNLGAADAGARAQAEVAQFQLEGAYLSLTSNIVTGAIQEAALREQMQATEEILKAQTNLAEVTEKQLVIGTVSKVDVTSQRTLVSNSQVDLFNYERNLAFARNQLAVLTGEVPSNASITKFDLSKLHLPEKLPLSVPSNLIRQRPDVRAAEAQLKAQNAFVGVATANLLPQLNITGSVGSAALTSANLFGPNSSLWSIGGGIANKDQNETSGNN